MYIESVPNRSSPPAILLRESFREQGRVRKRTLANLSAWPTALVEGFRTLLKGGLAVAADGIRIRRALPHGHATAVLGTIRSIGLDRLLGRPADKRLAPLAIALIASRLISPASKLATARDLAADTASSSLGRLLGLGAVDEVELYRALDWLGARQGAIETALARRHLKNAALVLYDVSSSGLEGRCCELTRFGYSRDGKKGKLQIVYGLLCAADGCPVAVEVFEGNTADPVPEMRGGGASQRGCARLVPMSLSPARHRRVTAAAEKSAILTANSAALTCRRSSCSGALPDAP